MEIALKGIISGEGETSEDVVATIKERYEKGENDEFLKPIIVNGESARVKGMCFPHQWCTDIFLFFKYHSLSITCRQRHTLFLQLPF